GLVPACSKAAIAAGADGLIVEVHPSPEDALSDGSQSLLPEKFGEMMADLRKLAAALGRTI
ncbi:MAG: 3-deoxy-7-phosphoheptulonate synthase, partial [Candidatus Omnitrophota bacterium]